MEKSLGVVGCCCSVVKLSRLTAENYQSNAEFFLLNIDIDVYTYMCAQLLVNETGRIPR